MSGRIRWRLSLLIIFIVIIYLIALIDPFYEAYVVRGVDSERQIDPEFFSGLLTASSILFGFSSLLVVSGKGFRRFLWIFLLPPLVLIITSVGKIGDVALGQANAVEALLFLEASLNANIFSNGFIFGFITRELWKKTPRRNEN